MRCEYNDGLQVSYSGKLRIRKEDEINVFLEQDDIPEGIQGELYEATIHEDCSGMRQVAQQVMDIVGTNLPE